MPNCQNPECQKEIPEGMNYCGEDCLKRHLELKKQRRQQEPEPSQNVNLRDTSSEWAGQDRARRTMNSVLKVCLELCPMEKETLIAHLRYRVGLHWRKIEEDYFRTLHKIGALQIDTGNIVTVSELGKTLSEKYAPKGEAETE